MELNVMELNELSGIKISIAFIFCLSFYSSFFPEFGE